MPDPVPPALLLSDGEGDIGAFQHHVFPIHGFLMVGYM
jgi:hypothetical protein